MYQTTGGILSPPNRLLCVGALEQDPKLARYANSGPEGLLGGGSRVPAMVYLSPDMAIPVHL